MAIVLRKRFLVAALLVTLSGPAGAVAVDDETTFRDAWSNADETRIDLAADITLTCGGGGAAHRNSATPLTLDGHGHSITQTCADRLALVLNNAPGDTASTFRNVTVTSDNAPNTVSGGIGTAGDPNAVSQLIAFEVREQNEPRRHQPSRHESSPAPAVPVQAVARFTG